MLRVSPAVPRVRERLLVGASQAGEKSTPGMGEQVNPGASQPIH